LQLFARVVWRVPKPAGGGEQLPPQQGALVTRLVFHRTDAAILGYIEYTFLALLMRQDLLDTCRHAAVSHRNGVA
jgi:hypothetical protein